MWLEGGVGTGRCGRDEFGQRCRQQVGAVRESNNAGHNTVQPVLGQGMRVAGTVHRVFDPPGGQYVAESCSGRMWNQLALVMATHEIVVTSDKK